MGLFNGILGNASEIDVDEIRQEYAKLLASGERIERAYRLIRDLFIFTDKRLILVDVQGLTGKKIDDLAAHTCDFSRELAARFS